MAGAVKESDDFYAVLGLKKECTAADLRNAYKKLALKWHPDRCSTAGNTDYAEEAKKKFQTIQQAYSVLSDSNKRFLYDLGVYDSEDDDDENKQANESLEELQLIFNNMFESDLKTFGSSCFTTPSTYCPSSGASYNEMYCKRNSCEISSASMADEPCKEFLEVERKKDPLVGREVGERIIGSDGDSRRSGRKQKVLHGQDVSSGEYSSISA